MLRSLDVYCAPNTGGESFGIILTEAMSAGTPVVASDLDAFRRVLDGGIAGVLSPGRRRTRARPVRSSARARRPRAARGAVRAGPPGGRRLRLAGRRRHGGQGLRDRDRRRPAGGRRGGLTTAAGRARRAWDAVRTQPAPRARRNRDHAARRPAGGDPAVRCAAAVAHGQPAGPAARAAPRRRGSALESAARAADCRVPGRRRRRRSGLRRRGASCAGSPTSPTAPTGRTGRTPRTTCPGRSGHAARRRRRRALAAELADASERVRARPPLLQRRRPRHPGAARRCCSPGCSGSPGTRRCRSTSRSPRPVPPGATGSPERRPAGSNGSAASNGKAATVAAPVVRTAARVVLLDDDDRVLLLSGTDPRSTPDRGGSRPVAGSRTARTCTRPRSASSPRRPGVALRDGDLVGPIWRRMARFVFTGVDYEQTEYYFAARRPDAAVASGAPTDGHPGGAPTDGHAVAA